MTSNQVTNPDKIKAWYRRMDDNGWGRAFAHLLPIYPVWYAFSRRTVTPLAWQLGGGMLLGLMVAVTTPDTESLQARRSSLLLSLVTTPLLAKMGINQSRAAASDNLSNLS